MLKKIHKYISIILIIVLFVALVTFILTIFCDKFILKVDNSNINIIKDMLKDTLYYSEHNGNIEITKITLKYGLDGMTYFYNGNEVVYKSSGDGATIRYIEPYVRENGYNISKIAAEILVILIIISIILIVIWIIIYCYIKKNNSMK